MAVGKSVQNLPSEKIRSVVFRQLILTLLISAAAFLIGKDQAVSALIGGLGASLANAVFGYWVFSAYQAQKPGKLLTKLYVAEFAKLVLTGIIFLAAILFYENLSLVAMLVTYFIVHVTASLLVATYGKEANKG